MARTLVIMGSGETTPGMLGLHRQVFAGVDPKAARVVLDSPFAFQMNADELVDKIARYFAESLGQRIDRVSLPVGADQLVLARAVAQIGTASWVFAGPGSPSYARRAWAGTPVPDALADVVAPGASGVLVFASAAAVTLGDWSLPVYEIYKVGLDPFWEPGLGLMDRLLGLRCAVMPHYDNREGGTHDTRYCWVGQERLARIEGQLDGGFILGVDEHTALVVDLDADSCSVYGRGGVTIRLAGAETVLPSGSSFPVQQIRDMAGEVRRGRAGAPAAPFSPESGAARVGAAEEDPFQDQVGRADPPRGVTDLAEAVLAALPAGSDARAALVTLADLASGSARLEQRAAQGPFVEALMAERAHARAARDWAGSDRIRDALVGLGVEVRDTREGSEWTWRD